MSASPATGPPRLGWHLVGESGGLRYHLRARLGGGGWAPFHAAVAGWLAGWAPHRTRLILVGPSAGYALPAGFLQRFEQVEALEPDPLARWLLRRRPGGGAVTFAPLDALAGRPGLEALARLSSGDPGATPPRQEAAILFCNVLGQVLAPPGRSWRALLAATLAERAWASFHDVFSTERAPDDGRATLRLAGPRPLGEVLERFWTGGELDGIDHDTLGLGGDGPHHYALWRLGPGRHHLVEWHAHAPR